MSCRLRVPTVMRRARDICMRPWTWSRPRPAPASDSHSGLRQVGPGQLRHADPGERIMMPVIGGRVLRVAVREGSPAWQPLLLCNGFGARLEMLQPFVDALDPQRVIVRFDMPGPGVSLRAAGRGRARDPRVCCRRTAHRRGGPGSRGLGGAAVA